MAIHELKATQDANQYLTIKRPKHSQCFFSIVKYFQGNCVHSTVYRKTFSQKRINKQIIDEGQAIQ